MLRHYSKLFKRNIVKYKFSFFINMVGLSTALACVTLIYLWVNDELLTDTFHEKDDRIFHLMEFYEFPQQTIANEVTSGNMAQLLLEEMPEVVRAVRVAKYLDNATLSIADKTIKGVGQYVDKDYFKVFSFHLIQGDKNNLWADMGTIVLSETMANSFFGSPGQAIGKTLTLQNEKQFTVSGVFTDIPKQSSEKFDFVLSYEELIPSQPNLMDWGSQSTYLYLEMEPGANVLAFNEKIHDLIREKTGNGQMHRTPFIKKYSEGYLYGKYENGIQTGGRITYVKLFAVIASFILVIACINFMNLSTARASRRLKEIGIKKVVGANRKTLIFQYLIEAIALTSMALVLSLIYVALLLPEFNRITGKQLTMDFSIGFILSVLAITLFTGLFSGSYPALYLSGFNPVSILKGKLNTSIGEVWTRKGLVIIQYMVSVILIVSVLVIYRQIEFIQNKNLGYVKEQIIHFDREGKTMDRNHMDTFLAELERVPGVISASSSRNKMTNQGWGVGGFDWEGKDPNDHTSFQNMIAYYGLLEMMDIELVEGRTFSKNFASEHTKVILNEAAIAHMQLKDPVGKTINFRGMDREIIAVVKNFHFESLHENIKPMIINLWPDRLTKFMVKITAGKEKETLILLEKLYQEFNPGFLFDYRFLDENYQELYKAERRVSVLSGYFAALAIIISCLGLFGLVSFTAERRKKEIGIRKVLGASSARISFLLSSEFVKLVCIAILVGLPISHLLTDNWLSEFAYRTVANLWYFLLAGAFVALITLVMVCIQTLVAANANPVKSLRTE